MSKQHVDRNDDIHNPTYDEIVDMLLSMDGLCIRFLSNPSDKQIDLAIDNHPGAILNIPESRRTKERWLKAISEPYYDYCSNHPISGLKESGLPKEDIKELYIEFIKHSGTVLGGDLITDFKSVLSTEETVDIWKAIVKYTDDPQFAFMSCDCPEKVYKYAVDLDVRNLLCFDISMWKLPDIVNAIAVRPNIIHKVFLNLQSCGGGYAFIDIIRLAIDRCELGFDIKCILMECDQRIDLESFKVLMQSNNWYKILNHALFYCDMDRVKALYVFEYFNFGKLVEKVDKYTLRQICYHLPLFKKMKYLRKIKKGV